VGHYPLRRSADVVPDVAATLAADDERRVMAAIGATDARVRTAYRALLLDSMVHEINAVRGLLGEPDELLCATLWGDAAASPSSCPSGPRTPC
jgi:hypothetical protein